MDWNKDHIRETMLSLETAALHSARDNYLDYVSTARLDRSEPIENDKPRSQAISLKRSTTLSMIMRISSTSCVRSISGRSQPLRRAPSSSCPASTS